MSDVPSWNTVTYLGNVACETCGWYWNGDAERVAAGRHAARRHAARNPGHRVAVDVGKSTVYGESHPSGRGGEGDTRDA